MAQMQAEEEMREAALRPAADPRRAQGGLPLSPQRHERAAARPKQNAISLEVKVGALQVEWSALAWMAVRQRAPRQMDKAELPGLGEVNVGKFWINCKSRRRCGRPPYDRLLTNPVLRADYRTRLRGTSDRQSHPMSRFKPHGPNPSALRWMERQAQPPKCREQTILDGGAKLGVFWSNCKRRKRCARSPYDQLLSNPILRTDYRIT